MLLPYRRRGRTQTADERWIPPLGPAHPDGPLELPAFDDMRTRLAGLGVHIAIDDVGAGYSSLAYLKRLPVDDLTIDRGFVTPMTTESGDATIVAATIRRAPHGRARRRHRGRGRGALPALGRAPPASPATQGDAGAHDQEQQRRAPQ